jgi:hypothetical protein
MTRERLIEIARTNGALQNVIGRLLQEGERVGPRLTVEQATEMAEHIIVDHGDTTRWEPGQVMRPSAPSPEPTWDGPRTRGWRVTGQAHRLRVEQLFLGPRRRAADEREAIDIPVRTAKRTLARRAKAALTANPDAPERPAGGVPAGPGHRRRRNRAQPPRGRQ